VKNMKIWISETNSAPDGYHWSKDANEAIKIMQDTDLRIDRAIRNRLMDIETGKPVSIADMRVSEISAPAEMVNGRGCNVLRMFLEESGRTERCPIIAR
jgi:hypothetical protein